MNLPSDKRVEMWLPTTETKVTVTQVGEVQVWDEITMEKRIVQKPAGFGEDTKDALVD